jgi:tetratricopeptide (TPR) repeat protein
MSESRAAHISDLAVKLGSGPSWAMVRTQFDIQSFGVNAWLADEPGLELIGEHDEVGERAAEHEELYFVGSGHATFTVAGDEIDAPAGTFVFVRDPGAKRKAVSTEAGTTIIAVGGKPGEAFTPSVWERNAPALVHFASGEYDKAIEVFEGLLAESPDDPGVLYNLACAESLSGKHEEAIAHLGRAVDLDDNFRGLAKNDSDFDPIRDDPRFPSAIAGQPDADGSGA